MRHHPFFRRILRSGLIIVGIRLAVMSFWLFLDRTGHASLTLLPILIVCIFAVFPEGIIFEHWIRAHGLPSSLGVIVMTSFLLAAWILLTESDTLNPRSQVLHQL